MKSVARVQIQPTQRGLFDAIRWIIEPRERGRRQPPGLFEELFETWLFGGKIKKAKTFYVEVGRGLARTEKALPLRHARYDGWIRVADSKSGQVTATVYGSWEILGAFVGFISRRFSKKLKNVTITYPAVQT